MRFRNLALLAPLAVFAACSSKSVHTVTGNDTTSTNPPNPPPNAATVTVRDFMFAPRTVTISVGGKVTWINTGPSVHSVVSDTGQAVTFNSGQIAPGSQTGATPGTFSFTFTTAGTFNYKDPAHTEMTGSVVVR